MTPDLSNNAYNPVASVRTTGEKILDAARSEFARFGLAGGRVDRIARSAGVNKAMIYYHYSSKENLYREVLSGHFRRVGQLLKTRLTDLESIQARLEAAADVWMDVFAEMPEFRSLVLRELAQPSSELLDQIADVLIGTGLPEAIPQLMSDEISAGRFREVDTRQALVSFVTMNIGYFLISPLINRVLSITDENDFIRNRKRAVIDLFFNGIKVRKL